MRRKLFCDLGPTAYKISVFKCAVIKRIKDAFSGVRFAKAKEEAPFPYLVYKNKSLILRRLGNVDMSLQEGKKINLSLAAPHINGITVLPGETFSFWHTVGKTNAKKGYQNGLIIYRGGETRPGIGGGMCQFSNLIHWLVLHSPLEITEHHHHDGVDLFPDYGRQIPFGTGTSISEPHVDYRFKNNTDVAFQLITYVDGEYLCGELRSSKPLNESYHIYVADEFFTDEADGVYRNNEIYREVIDKATGNRIENTLLRKNHAKIQYDRSFVEDKIRN